MAHEHGINEMSFSYFTKSLFIIIVSLGIWCVAFFSGSELCIYSSYLLWLPIVFLFLGIGRHIDNNQWPLWWRSVFSSTLFAISMTPGLVPGHPPAPAPAIMLLLSYVAFVCLIADAFGRYSYIFHNFSDVLFNLLAIFFIWILALPFYLVFLSKRRSNI